jgi:hypothetical protein
MMADDPQDPQPALADVSAQVLAMLDPVATQAALMLTDAIYANRRHGFGRRVLRAVQIALLRRTDTALPATDPDQAVPDPRNRITIVSVTPEEAARMLDDHDTSAAQSAPG